MKKFFCVLCAAVVLTLTGAAVAAQFGKDEKIGRAHV